MPSLNEQELPLHTRKNWRIPNTTAPEKPAVSRQASVEIWKEQRPKAELRSITAKYNCMGMIFASRRTHVDPKHLRKILSDDGYSPVKNKADLMVGDLVVYLDAGDVTHVGVVTSKTANVVEADFNIKVMSKWGHEGEYIHDLRDVPEVFGLDIEFYTDRTLP